MPATHGQETVVRGQDFTWTLTLEGSGSISGATLAANIRRRGSRQVLTAPVPAIVDAAARTVSVALTDTTSALLEGDPADPTKEIEHVLDVSCTLSGTTTYYGPLVFRARTPA